ncbi:MAG: DUF4156 domain-containing protein [Deltaproteobacteria bacterium]|nr:DUF4156 domain-containing protein [Deltaproteobacteria bacterium]
MESTTITLSSICRGRDLAWSAGLMFGVMLAHAACYEFAEVERPVAPRMSMAARQVVLSRTVPEGCTLVGEVSGTGSATDDPSLAAERARDSVRIRAANMGANYVVLEMQTGGPSRTEGRTEGWAAQNGPFMSETTVTSELEVALWGTAMSCPHLTTAVPDEYAPCNVHDDCPPHQFCAPSGVCRRP